jgi:UDP:flavonoid glycosyltransferase YjiC (YdhE family)
MRALFCSFGEPGYLYPLIGLALEMRRRGDQVAFAAPEEAHATLRAVDLERIARRASDGRSFQVQHWGSPTATAIDVKHIEHALRVFPADVVVTHQLCNGALVVRERAMIPTGVLGFLSYLWPTRGSGANGAEVTEPLHAWRLRDSIGMLDAARAVFGLGPAEASSSDHALLGDLFLLRSVPDLERDLDVLPDKVHAVGACLWEPPDAATAWSGIASKFVNPEAPLVFVHQGRAFGKRPFWPCVAEAVADRPLQVVAETGRMDQEVGAVPPNVVLCDRAPLGRIMQRARVALSSGNTSGVVAAGAHGVAQIVVPTGGETPDNARRLSHARCAITLAAESVTAMSLRECLERVMGDDEMHEACGRLQRAFGAFDSFAVAAELVRRLHERPGARADVGKRGLGAVAGSRARSPSAAERAEPIGIVSVARAEE